MAFGQTMSESLTWAAASLPFEVLDSVPGILLRTKKLLQAFHNPPADTEKRAALEIDELRPNVANQRIEPLKKALERALNKTNAAQRGFTSAGRINGPRPVHEEIDNGLAVNARVQNAIYTIQNTVNVSIFKKDGILASERNGALCVHACDVLTRAADEIEACVKKARETAARIDPVYSPC